MKISSKGRYALRFMCDLAANGKNGLVSLKAVSERQNIGIKYLELIASMLLKAGFIESVRGPMGGYRLSMQPEEYTAAMILNLTEGNLAPVPCLEKAKNNCELKNKCYTLKLWEKMNSAVYDVLNSTTLADLTEEKKSTPDYVLL